MTHISLEASTEQNVLTPPIGQFVKRARQFLSEIAKRRAIRGDLGNLSEHHMRDIGFTKNDVTASTSSPITFDSAQELYKLKTLRAQNW